MISIRPTWFGRTIARLVLFTPLGDSEWFCSAHLWAMQRWPRLFRVERKPE